MFYSLLKSRELSMCGGIFSTLLLTDYMQDTKVLSVKFHGILRLCDLWPWALIKCASAS